LARRGRAGRPPHMRGPLCASLALLRTLLLRTQQQERDAQTSRATSSILQISDESKRTTMEQDQDTKSKRSPYNQEVSIQSVNVNSTKAVKLGTDG